MIIPPLSLLLKILFVYTIIDDLYQQFVPESFSQRHNVTTAKMSNWWICGILACAVTFLISDFGIIGHEPTQKEYSKGKELDKKLTYKYSFYRSMDKAVKPGNGTLINSDMTPGEKGGLIKEKKKVVSNLNKGGDVRYTFSFNTTIWCAIFFFGFSMLFKGMSEAAKVKPIKWPY